MLAAIRGAEQRCRSGARKDNVGVDRINGEGPDGHLVHGRVEPLPMFAAVPAAVDAAVRATVHDTSVTGMHRQGAHGAFAIKADRTASSGSHKSTVYTASICKLD